MDKDGQTVLADLVRNKLKHLDKINQYNERLVKKLKCEKTAFIKSDLKENHWLAGFLQGDGCLVLYQPKRGNSVSPAAAVSLKPLRQADFTTLEDLNLQAAVKFLETRIFVQVAQKKKGFT
jgi:hypothetical protein